MSTTSKDARGHTMLKLQDYQEEHINELNQKIEKFIDLESNKICVLHAPTGSGKTVMMAELIKRMADNNQDGKEFAFIWITVHRLHDQAKEKLERYYEDTQSITCSNFEDLEDIQIQDREILFFNWHSINQKNNIYVRDNERGFNLSNIIENTRNADREIILIIDESHHTANSEKSKEIIQNINPKITIEVSATPKISNIKYVQSVEFQKVRDAGMIKNSIRLNHHLDKTRGSITDELIIKTALEKRQELETGYKNEDSNVNPLILIQLPNSGIGILDKKDYIVWLLNSKFGINVENGKLAIYLSDKADKVNFENIEKNDGEVQVLIFKQAITVGWDCPRASILILFREWKKIEFSIQTVGRIIRMPETKHYQNDELNHAYIYTNIKKIQIAQDVTKDYITVHEALRKEKLYEDIDLTSAYKKRQRAKIYLNSEFRSIFSRITNKQQFIDKISLKVPRLKQKVITNMEIQESGNTQSILQGKLLSRRCSEMDIQNKLDDFIIKMIPPYTQKFSQESIAISIYGFFEKNTKITDYTKMANIALSVKNKDHFISAINKSKEVFAKKTAKKIDREIQDIPKWNIPKNMEYPKAYKEKDYKKYIMSPVFISANNTSDEIQFMDFLDNENNNVRWWFKNECRDKKSLAIKYQDSETGRSDISYVDFIIMMNDGRIGLYNMNTKVSTEIIKLEIKALSKYIKDNKSKKVFGGTVVYENGEWLYNDSKEYECNSKDFSDWKSINLD